MPVIFKSDKRDPLIIDKDGTLFYFDLPEGIRRQVRINMYATGDKSDGTIIAEAFRRSLYQWDNLVNEAGEPIPFSLPVRDAVCNDTEIFTDDDVLKFYQRFFAPEVEKKTQQADPNDG